jgi:hypothetical protein
MKASKELFWRHVLAPTLAQPEVVDSHDFDTVTRVMGVCFVALTLAETQNAQLVLVFCPPLNGPLAAAAVNPPPEYKEIMAWADGNDVAFIWLAETLQEYDVAAIRLDECCHFNATGHELLADALFPFLPGTANDPE